MSPADSEPRPSGKDEVTQALIAAARSLIGRWGVSGVSTRSIAAEARVNQGLITRHFGSKQALVRAVADQVAGELFEEVVRAGLSLEDLLFGGGPGHGEPLRVLIRIILDRPDPHDQVVSGGLVARFLGWLTDQTGAPPGPGGHARVFLLSSLILGSELVTPTLAADLGLTADQAPALRREAFRLFLDGWQTPR